MRCVLRAQKKVYKNTSGARILQPSFGLVTVVTAQSHRMAEAGGDLWGGLSQSLLRQGHLGCVTCPPGEVQVCSAAAQAGAFPPLPPALRILNSPSMASAALGLVVGSAEPLCWPLCPLQEEFITSPLQEPPGLLSYLSSRDQGGSSSPLKSPNSSLRLLLPVEGLILSFPH